MFGMFLANVLDSEIINDQDEHDRSFGMCPESGSVLDRTVSARGKVFDELLFGNATCLGESMHALFDTGTDAAIDDLVPEVTQIHDFLGNHLHGDARVLESVQSCVETKILGIGSHPSGIFPGQHGVDEQLSSHHIGDTLAGCTGTVNFVAADCSSNSALLFLLWMERASVADAGNRSICRDLIFVDKKESISAFCVLVSLHQVAKFLACRFLPQVTFRTLDESRALSQLTGVGVDCLTTKG